MTTRIKLPDNGQQFDVEDSEVDTDDKVRALLTPVYPEARTATIKRTTEDGMKVISLVKQAGTKGIGLQGAFDVEDGVTVETVELPIEKVRTDGGTQIRFTTSYETIQEYAEAIRNGAVFPPVKAVLDDEGNYWLYDGFHTTAAHGVAGRASIQVAVRKGTKRDALLLAVGANQAHGLRRTNDDKRRAVLTLLNDAEWSGWADREIARQVGVSHTFVSNLRAEQERSLSGNGLQTPRMANRAGETYTFRPPQTEEDLKTAGQQEFVAPPTQEAPSVSERATTPLEAPQVDLSGEFATGLVTDVSVGFGGSPSGEPVDRDADEGEPTTTQPPTVEPSAPSAPSGLRPVTPAPSTPTAPAPSSLRPVAPAQPLTFEQAEITITLVLRPDDGAEGGRVVVMSSSCPGLVGTLGKAHRLDMYTPWQDPIRDALESFKTQLEAKAEGN